MRWVVIYIYREIWEERGWVSALRVNGLVGGGGGGKRTLRSSLCTAVPIFWRVGVSGRLFWGRRVVPTSAAKGMAMFAAVITAGFFVSKAEVRSGWRKGDVRRR